jgi:hypothetical protein
MRQEGGPGRGAGAQLLRNLGGLYGRGLGRDGGGSGPVLKGADLIHDQWAVDVSMTAVHNIQTTDAQDHMDIDLLLVLSCILNKLSFDLWR